jgi:nucleoside-diphosphate-sugar epimerase
VRRVVITSSIVAVVPHAQISNGDTMTVYTRESRIQPLPMGPYQNPSEGYRAAKALALDATEKFQREVNPSFSLVHIMPSYVFGANELVSDAVSVSRGSNSVLMSMLVGMKDPAPTVGTVVHVDDVSRIHVRALDEEKVPAGANFITSIPVEFENTLDIAKRLFPEAVEDGRLPLGGSRQTLPLTIDTQATVDVFGPFKGYEEMIKSVVGQYLGLLANKQ